MSAPADALPALPEGWFARWVFAEGDACGYWYAEPEGDGEVNVSYFPDGEDTYGNLGGVGMDDLMAVLAHLKARALASPDAHGGDGTTQSGQGGT